MLFVPCVGGNIAINELLGQGAKEFVEYLKLKDG